MYYLKKIGEILNSPVLGSIPSTTVQYLLTDSRRLIAPAHTLFIAIRSDRNDGINYIDELIEQGVKSFIIQTEPKKEWLFKAAFIVTKNSLTALQKLAEYHRRQFNLPVVGITGSNGKTTVKEWLVHILHPLMQIVASPGSHNSQIGVPLSVWQITKQHQLAIFEAGISEMGEMKPLADIIGADIGIITNIGAAHSAGFPDDYAKCLEKLRLFTNCKKIIYCRDHSLIASCIQNEFDLLFENSPELITWGELPDSDIHITEVEKSASSTLIRYQLSNQQSDKYKQAPPYKGHFTISLIDKASIENALHCRALLYALGITPQIADNLMEHIPHLPMRLELLEGINRCTIINDSYSNDLNSLIVALDFMEQQKGNKQRRLILSDILQSGKEEKELYQEVANLLQARKIDRFTAVGEALSRQKGLFPYNSEFFMTTIELLNTKRKEEFENELIVVKGARKFQFEAIAEMLQQKTHETVLEIDLEALINNLNYYRNQLPAGVKTTAMVKAFGYGSGSFEIAHALQFHHVDYLAVAYTDEGVELRKAGITTPIMVMNPEERSYQDLVKWQLEPEVYSLRILNQLAETINYHFPSHSITVHIKLDTGMHRLGFEEEHITQLMRFIEKNDHFIIGSIFSHLAGSEDPALDYFTQQQIDLFDRMSKKIMGKLAYQPLLHILNSAGILRFPSARYTMVRLGLGLYGLGESEQTQSELKPVSKLKSVISQIKTIKPGESVGYNRRFIANRTTKVAIIPIGYADGLNRQLAYLGGGLWINNQFAPFTGSISMDMCAVDITSIPDVSEGDEVIVFETSDQIKEISNKLNTIPYEVLTGISRRVKRIYKNS